jgi:hypothetical protein
LARALRSGRRGRKFKSCLPDSFLLRDFKKHLNPLIFLMLILGLFFGIFGYERYSRYDQTYECNDRTEFRHLLVISITRFYFFERNNSFLGADYPFRSSGNIIEVIIKAKNDTCDDHSYS